MLLCEWDFSKWASSDGFGGVAAFGGSGCVSFISMTYVL